MRIWEVLEGYDNGGRIRCPSISEVVYHFHDGFINLTIEMIDAEDWEFVDKEGKKVF